MSKFTFYVRVIVANLIGYRLCWTWYAPNLLAGLIHSSIWVAFGVLMFYGSKEAWYWDKITWADIYNGDVVRK